MKLLLLTNIFASRENPHGGSFIRSRVSALHSLGNQVEAIALGVIPHGRDGLRPTAMTDATVRMGTLDRVRIRTQGRVGRLELAAAKAISEVVDVRDFDAVMAHGMYAPAAGRVAQYIADSNGIPHTIHLHGSDVNQLMPKARHVFVPTLHRAAANIFVSQALLRTAQGFGYSGNNHLVIPNGIDTKVFKPTDAAARGDSSFLYVGNLLKVKGADRLPRIFTDILRSNPQAHFNVVGDGPLRRRLESATRDLPVSFHGTLPSTEVARLMGEASLLMLPSRSEGWPTVINESYAMGTPVVATHVGGVPEAVLDWKHLVPDGPGFERRFADRCVEVSGYDDIANLRSRAAQFEWESLVKRELDALSGRNRDT